MRFCQQKPPKKWHVTHLKQCAGRGSHAAEAGRKVADGDGGGTELESLAIQMWITNQSLNNLAMAWDSFTDTLPFFYCQEQNPSLYTSFS